MKQLVSIPLQQVTLSESRPTVPETVNALAESMRELGLMQPVTLRALPGQGYRVVAGNHRVSAARALGWRDIEAFVIAEHGQDDQELREIDENLVRAALTPAQRAWAIKRRKEIWERLYGVEQEPAQGEKPESGAICATLQRPKTGRGHVQFAAETAERTGQSKAAVNRHAARGEALGDSLHEIAGTSLDKGVELDALRSLPEEDRQQLIERARGGEQVSARRLKHRRYLGGVSDQGEPQVAGMRAEHICPNCGKGPWKVRSSEQVHSCYRIRYRYCPECGCRGKTGEETLEIHHLGASPNPTLLPLLSSEAREEIQRLTETP